MRRLQSSKRCVRVGCCRLGYFEVGKFSRRCTHCGNDLFDRPELLARTSGEGCDGDSDTTKRVSQHSRRQDWTADGDRLTKACRQDEGRVVGAQWTVGAKLMD